MTAKPTHILKHQELADRLGIDVRRLRIEVKHDLQNRIVQVEFFIDDKDLTYEQETIARLYFREVTEGKVALLPRAGEGMTYTAETVRAEITPERREKFLAALLQCEDIPAFMRTDSNMQDMWVSGEWLGEKLRAAGCSEELEQKICVAHGQRCVFSEPFAVAAEAWNEWVAGRPVLGGPELAKELNDKYLVVKDARHG